MSKYHVASASEEMLLLPREVVTGAMSRLREVGIDTVWMVDETTNEIDSGYAVDIANCLFFSFIIHRELDTGLFELLPVSDWKDIGELRNELGGSKNDCPSQAGDGYSSASSRMGYDQES